MSYKLYHVELGLPFNLNLPKSIRVRLTEHAVKATTDDKYGDIVLPLVRGELQLAGMKLVELETLNDRPVKIVVRGSYAPNPKYDLVLVLTSSGILKTCWLNDSADSHATLNRSKYTIPAK